AIRRAESRSRAQSEQGFADANTGISADAVPHLQVLDICQLFFFVNDTTKGTEIVFPVQKNPQCRIANKEAASAR
ncbi:MAG: hypothetical protein IJG46_00870, partial [Prevotella sp.]|nr:hypothetical protein [Prevotella sp.]